MRRNSRLIATLLGGFLLLGAAMPSLARDKCEDRVRKAEEKVRHESDRHGERSHQAENARRNLDKERANCRVDDHHDHHDDQHHDYR